MSGTLLAELMPGFDATDYEVGPLVDGQSPDECGLLVRHRSAVSKLRISSSKRSNLVLIGPHSRINGKVKFIGTDGRAVFGASVQGGADVLLGHGNRFEVGDNTRIVQVAFVATEGQVSITVGKHCLFSDMIVLRATDGHSIFDGETGDRINPPRSIVVEDRVWLGTRVAVSKGAHIGSGCVVGQGSLVTGRLEPRCLYVGTPAKLRRENILWHSDRAEHASQVRFPVS